MIKRSLTAVFISSLSIASLVVLGSSSAQADKSNFQVRNGTRSPIVELYTSSSTRSNWGDDVLQGQQLQRGESAVVSFGTDTAQDCLYDFQAVLSNGQTITQYQVNVCESSDYTFQDS